MGIWQIIFKISEQNYAKTEAVVGFDTYESFLKRHHCGCRVLLRAVIKSKRLTMKMCDLQNSYSHVGKM